MAEDGEDEALRLDVWLWRARFFKTRALAMAHIKRRGVRITRHGDTRRVDKPSATVRVGDILTFSKAKVIQTLQVAAFGVRRGPASEAQTLYVFIGDDNV